MEVVDDVDVEAFRTQVDAYLRENFNEEQLDRLRGDPGHRRVTGVGEVQTFRGPVAAGRPRARRCIHEHVFVGHPELDLNFPDPEWDEDGGDRRRGRRAGTAVGARASAPSST